MHIISFVYFNVSKGLFMTLITFVATCIYFCCPATIVTQYCLNISQICSVFKQEGRKAMPQGMRFNCISYAC
jgi:hypothetical protein